MNDDKVVAGTQAAIALRTPGPALRDRIVAAAVQALQELTPAQLITAIGTRELARRVGASPGSIFHHFGSVEALAEAVLARVFDPRTLPTDSINDLIESVTRSTLPAEASRLMHTNEFDRLSNDPELRVRVGLWALGGPSTDSTYAKYLQSTEAAMQPFAEKLFSSWGRELRPPWNMKSFIAAHVALLNGASVRRIIDPDAVDRDRFARAASSMTLSALRLRGDTHTVDDRLSEINYYPLRDTRTLRPLTDAASNRRALVLDIAADLFAMHGYRETKLAQIARAAQISESTLYQQFPSKSALAAELFRKQAADMIATRMADRTAPQTEPEQHAALHQVLVHFATFVATHTEVAGAYSADLIAKPTEMVTDLLLETVSDHLTAVARSRGVDSVELAVLAVLAIINRVVRHPAGSPDECSRRALVMLGIAGPPDSDDGPND